ncbi:hypothetical protein GCM10029976_032930 [Kribbella albertanoniae]|uniref:Uncharacterized protein n=1 Tax=Kribbella albertanoniae TaxID=1266829 RepID=A0A4R4QIS6_9ACTN|nr:hypothetical protein [Kribbella albertanoniae]TDC35490.1 hypothetical protein E1261_01095 [Kribbella albertanoniae]
MKNQFSRTFLRAGLALLLTLCMSVGFLTTQASAQVTGCPQGPWVRSYWGTTTFQIDQCPGTGKSWAYIAQSAKGGTNWAEFVAHFDNGATEEITVEPGQAKSKAFPQGKIVKFEVRQNKFDWRGIIVWHTWYFTS